jgi:hypothetical protein
MLKSGIYAEARVISCGPSAMEVKVTRSENLHDLPLGIQSLPLASVATIQTELCVGARRKALPLLLVGILAPSLGFTADLKERWALPAAAGTAAGAALLAYWGGKASDCPTLTISLIDSSTLP